MISNTANKFHSGCIPFRNCRIAIKYNLLNERCSLIHLETDNEAIRKSAYKQCHYFYFYPTIFRDDISLRNYKIYTLCHFYVNYSVTEMTFLSFHLLRRAKIHFEFAELIRMMNSRWNSKNIIIITIRDKLIYFKNYLHSRSVDCFDLIFQVHSVKRRIFFVTRVYILFIFSEQERFYSLTFRFFFFVSL